MSNFSQTVFDANTNLIRMHGARSFLAAAALFKFWQDTVPIVSQDPFKRESRIITTSDFRFHDQGILEVDQANATSLAYMPLDVIMENLRPAQTILYYLGYFRSIGAQITDEVIRRIAASEHDDWRRRNHYRMAERPHLNKPFAEIPESSQVYNIEMVKVVAQFILPIAFYGGTMELYEEPRKTLIKYTQGFGHSQSQTYNPQIEPDKWSLDLLPIEIAVQQISNCLVYFFAYTGNPQMALSTLTINEIDEGLTNRAASTVLIADSRGLLDVSKKAHTAYQALIKKWRAMAEQHSAKPHIYEITAEGMLNEVLYDSAKGIHNILTNAA